MAAGFGMGDLVATLGLDSRRYDQGLEKAAKSQQRFAKEANQVGLQMSGRFKSSLTQASFAVDDFFGVLQNSGDVGAALRATSNNIGTLVTAINPLAGIATTVALAFGSSLVKGFTDAGEAAEDLADRTEAAMKRIDKAREQRQRKADLEEQRRGIADIVTGRTDKPLEKERRKAEAAIREQQEELTRLNAEIRLIERGITAPQVPAHFSRQRFADTGAIAKENTRRERAAEQRRRDATRELREQRKTAMERLTAQQQLLKDVQRGEEQLKIKEDFNRLAGRFGRRIGGTQFGLGVRSFFGDSPSAQRSQKEQQREAERAAKDAEQKREKALDIRQDLTSKLLDEEARKVFDINRRYKEQADLIREITEGKEEAGLLTLNEAARQKELADVRKPRGADEPGQLAAFLQRGSAEAASAVNRAAARARDDKLVEKSILSEAMKQTGHLSKIAGALANGAPVLGVIQNLGGGGAD